MSTESTYPQEKPALHAPEAERAVYDAVVIGGGLAGLSLSIQLAKQGWSVALLEKEQYPFHRVCGEYISLESWNFLERLGYPLSSMSLPVIKNLVVSAPSGNYIRQQLPQGGFGISRYKIDNELAALAKASGVHLLEGSTVRAVHNHQSIFAVECSGVTYHAKLVCGAFGKRSNLDIKWKRPFIEQKQPKLSNYIGVKYHIRTSHTPGTIALHNFENGYCGISRIEDDKFCLCYLTTAHNLAKSGSIARMEELILHRNPFLKDIFTRSEFLYRTPLTISQVSFEKKSLVENHVLMTGDAAGMITPLCGNGMSMALHASKIAAQLITQFLSGKISRVELEQQYVLEWNKRFSGRLQAGRIIQGLFGKPWLTDAFIRSVKPFPSFVSFLIRQTHGKPF